MRIGFDVTALSVALAGIYTYDLNLARSLVRIAPQHSFLFTDYAPLHGRRPMPAAVSELQAANAQVRRLEGLRHRKVSRWQPMQQPAWRGIAALADGALSPPWRALADGIMRQRLERALGDVDVFHSSDVLLHRQPGARNVVTIYDLTALLFPEYHTRETRELQARKHRFAQERADAVVTISETTRRDVLAHLGLPPERVHVVYGGVSPAFRPLARHECLGPVLEPLGLRDQEYLLYVGTLEPRKNLVRLVEAYAQLRHEAPAPCPRLVLAGTAGWGFDEVFRHIRALELDDQVTWLGRVADDLLPLLYAGALLFVYPSLYEGLGLPVLEAMACGTPVVASSAAALPEVVGGAGLLVDPLATHDLTLALARLLDDRDLRAALGAAGVARARQFSWERCAQQMLEVYSWPGA